MGKNKGDFENAGEKSCFEKNFVAGWRKWVSISVLLAIVVVVIMLCTGNKAADEVDEAAIDAQAAIDAVTEQVEDVVDQQVRGDDDSTHGPSDTPVQDAVENQV